MLDFLKRNWFVLSLLGLTLFVIPGIVLVVLALFKKDQEVNAWLEANWNISYQLALPPWLVLALLLIPLLIVLLYFLKLKRRPLVVPSTFLWKKTIEDLHVNALFQWLRQNVLLILQLLAALFLIYSTLGLRFHGRVTSGQHYILVIDNSASMAAKDVEPSRLEWAKQQALKEIEGAASHDYGMVIVFNSKATTLQAYTNNRAKLREAVQSIRQTQRPTRIEEALTLVDSLANPERSTEDQAVRPENEKPGEERTFLQPKGVEATMHLYTDGRYAKLSDSTIAGLGARKMGHSRVLGNVHVQYHRAGKEAADTDNLAIVSLNALRQADTPDAKQKGPERLHVLVRVLNLHAKETQAKVFLDVYQDGKLLHPDQRRIVLDGRELKKSEAGEASKDEPGAVSAVITAHGPQPAQGAVVFEIPPLDLTRSTVVHAYLDKNKDLLAADDEAWLVVNSLRKAKVLQVGPANPILDAFFEQDATERIVSWQKLSVADLETPKYRQLARAGDFDLVIFDRCAPAIEEDLPQSNTFFIDRPPPPWLKGDKSVKNPYLILSKRDHPLVRYISSVWDLGVVEMFAFDAKKNLDPKIQKAFEEEGANRRMLPGMTRLVEAAGALPVVFTMGRGPYTDLVLAFPLVNDQGDLTTNWPLQPSFPLFLRNVLYNLGNVDDSIRGLSTPAGDPILLRPEAGIKKLTVTSPEGKKLELTRSRTGEFAFADTDGLGVYKVEREDGGVGHFAVNLLDANESHIDPRHEIRMGSESIAAGTDERQQPRELWKWILTAALGLLLAEWMIYNRRVSV